MSISSVAIKKSNKSSVVHFWYGNVACGLVCNAYTPRAIRKCNFGERLCRAM